MKTSRETLPASQVWKCPNCGAWNSICRTNCQQCPQVMQDSTLNHGTGRETTANPIPDNGGRSKLAGNGRKNGLLNKTEERFRREWPCTVIRSGWVACWQTYRMAFPDGGEYRPDCVMVRHNHDILPTELPPAGSIIVEIKGGYRGPGWEHGYERFKRARLQWPQFAFHCYEEWKKGMWAEIMRVVEGGPF